MPSAGMYPVASAERLAVGKPRSRPRAAPWTTSPRIRCGRPRTAAAVATSPSRSASRTQVEAQRLPQLLHGVQVPGVAAAEAGVMADDDVAGLERVDEDGGYELLRREA